MRQKQQILHDMVDKGFNILDDKYQESTKFLPIGKQVAIEKFQEKYHENDKTLIKNLNKDVELLIINNSDMTKE